MAKRKTFRAEGFKPRANPVAAAFRLAPLRPGSVRPGKGAGSYRRRPRNERGEG